MDYKISVDYDDYFANSSLLKAKNIEVIGDSIMFITDKASITILENKNIRYMLHYSKRKKLLEILKYRSGILIGLFCVIFMIVMNSFRVSKITFNGTYPINDEITTYITSQNQQILFFDFHKNNYDYLSKELRSVFSEYEWINVSKKGSTVYVEIEPTTTKDIKKEEIVIGDIIAKKSGMVTQYAVFGGDGLIEYNQYVKEGDILIKGENTKAKGYVLATIYEQKTIEVLKVRNTKEYSGDVISYNQFVIFNKLFNINKKTNYNESDITSKVIFNIPYIVSFNKVEEYEKNDMVYTYDTETAITYAKTLIEDEFLKSKVLNEERILRIEELMVLEDDDSFKITFLIKKIESIGEFRKNI